MHTTLCVAPSMGQFSYAGTGGRLEFAAVELLHQL